VLLAWRRNGDILQKRLLDEYTEEKITLKNV
jgi:hypothetical protein